MLALSPACQTAPRPVSTALERCASCEGRRSAVCDGLAAADLRRLAGLGRTRALSRGHTLIWEGDEADLVANVRSGILQLTAASNDGTEQILGLLFPGDFVGQPFGGAAEHRVVALTEVSVCVMPRREFAGLLAELPSLTRALLGKTFADLTRARSWLRLLGRKSAGERVASLLWELFRRAGGEPGRSVPLPLSRQQMADVLGLTIETVSRKMRAFDRDGMISLPDLRSFVVDRDDALQRLAA